MNALKRIMNSGGAARIGVIAGVSLVVVAAAAVAAYRHFGSRVSTDDAQVDAHIAPIGAKVGGKVNEVNVHSAHVGAKVGAKVGGKVSEVNVHSARVGKANVGGNDAAGTAPGARSY